MQSCSAFSVLLVSVEIVVFTSGVVDAERNKSHLIRHVLLKDYDAMTLPVSNSSDPVYLFMSIGIKSFIQLDMKKQTLVSFGWLIVNWYDHFLTWDTEEYAAKVVHLPADMIWRPELVVFNFNKDRDSTSFDLSHSQPHSSSATESMTLFQSADSFSPSESTVSSSATIVTKCSSTNIDSTVPNVTGNGISGFSVARELPDTDKEAATPAVSEAGERGHKGSSSIQLAWRLMTKAKNLTPHERQWLSRTLDRMCFVVTVSVNVFSCLTFIVLMIVT